MKRRGEFYWPDHDEVGAGAILSHAAAHFPQAFGFVRGHHVALQAGGNVGVYPKRLSGYFGEVLTFEPDLAAFECLERNVGHVHSIRLFNEALGAAAGRCSVTRHANNAGVNRVVPGDDVAVVTIDSLALPVLDLIWLDVEGYEPDVLRGAEQTIVRLRPVVILEDMGLAADGAGAARNWLVGHGYREARRMIHDYVMVPAA